MDTVVDRPLPIAVKARLTSEVARAYFQAWLGLRRTDLPTTLRGLRDARPHGAPQVESRRLASAVRKVLGPYPARSRCLMQSLVLIRLLARREVDGSLVIGVRPGEAFGAHAWVELDGQPLLPTGDGEFKRLVEL